MAAATNTNTAGTVAPKPSVVSGALPEPVGTGIETVDPNAAGKGEDDATGSAGIDGWTIFWLAFGFAVFVFLWRKGFIASFRKFIAETREQLYKSTWPTADELKQHIVVVMISSVLLGAFTVFSDKIIYFIVWKGLLESGSSS
ncbi:MAG: preprotein translocase subunit SecE [Verrucomicrobiales bacterium]|jgi:preprotein translocase SecE subunit|nr:preprotein translocase subunit SecE [Verrucomicrobiales bacterium]MBT6450267.1 preprotein translocase subunit SecE [Verrucomicrobiales bacterium]